MAATGSTSTATATAGRYRYQTARPSSRPVWVSDDHDYATAATALNAYWHHRRKSSMTAAEFVRAVRAT